jgi:hypothetical protein
VRRIRRAINSSPAETATQAEATAPQVAAEP